MNFKIDLILIINFNFSVIAMGARGGRGSGGMGSTLGSLVRGVIELEKEQQLYFLIGQPGSDACPKVCLCSDFMQSILYLKFYFSKLFSFTFIESRS